MTGTVQITESYKPALERLELKLDSDVSQKQIGRAAVALVQDNFRELPPNERDFPSTHFWQRAVEATSYRIEQDDVVVRVEQIGIRQRYLGGQITATRAKFLTIPAIAATYGYAASDFNDLKVVRGHFITYWGREVSLALVPKDWQEESFNANRVSFWLVQRVVQAPNSEVLPTHSALFAAIAEGYGKHIRDLFTNPEDK